MDASWIQSVLMLWCLFGVPMGLARALNAYRVQRPIFVGHPGALLITAGVVGLFTLVTWPYWAVRGMF